MLGGIGVPELLIILVIVLIIFGAGKLPQIGGNLGKAIRNFKASVREDKTEKVEAAAPSQQIEPSSTDNSSHPAS